MLQFIFMARHTRYVERDYLIREFCESIIYCCLISKCSVYPDCVCLVTLARVILSSLLSGRAAKDNILSLLAHLKLLCPDEPKEASQGTSRLLNHRPQDGLRVLLRPQLPVTLDKCLTKMND